MVGDSALLARSCPMMPDRAFGQPRGRARPLENDLRAAAAFDDGFGLDHPVLGHAVTRNVGCGEVGNGGTVGASVTLRSGQRGKP